MISSITVKLVFGLIGLLLVVYLLGKKSMPEITSFSLVYTLILGGILEESTYNDNVHVGHVLLAAAFWAVMIYGIERIVQKNEKTNRWVRGELSVLIKDGVINVTELADNHIGMEQLRVILRQQECLSPEDAKYVILENTGQMSVLKKSDEDKVLSILFVDEGQIQHKVLQSNQLVESWLMENLKKEGYADVRQLIYARWSEKKELYILNREDVMYESYRVDGQIGVVRSTPWIVIQN